MGPWGSLRFAPVALHGPADGWEGGKAPPFGRQSPFGRPRHLKPLCSTRYSLSVCTCRGESTLVGEPYRRRCVRAPVASRR